MKKITTLLFLSIAFQSFAIDRFVDPNLSAGNGTTLFTTITSAITAAVNGDRIIVASNTYNEAALTIGKSLQIMPQTPGTTINFNANITIEGFPGMKLEITGVNLGIYSFNSNSITNGSYTNRAKISFIECSCNNIEFDKEFYEVYIIKNTLTGNVTFRNGNIIMNTMNSCYLKDENYNDLTDKILISNNTINETLYLYNSAYAYIIANNILKTLYVKRWNSNSQVVNKIINNNFVNNSNLMVSVLNVPYYNIKFNNNKFLGTVKFWNNIGPCGPHACISTYNSDYGCNPSGAGCYWDFMNNSEWPSAGTPGFFEWSYNGIDLPCINPTSTQPLSLTKITGPSTDVNGGSPNHEYYDIDLTINDRGINGGPYSQLNYNAANSNNSKAFIFYLDMPSDLFPGQNVEIKAKGYHKN